jgi:ribonuclease HI
MTNPSLHIKTLNIYTDGSCIGNPGPGGWAFHIVELELSKAGSSKETTNNKMEMNACIKALEWVSDNPHVRVIIHTDSNYTKMGIYGKNGNDGWIHNWKKRDWKTAQKKPVLNQEYWKKLDALTQKLNVSWKWVKAHNGDKYNEIVDKLAYEMAKKSSS